MLTTTEAPFVSPALFRDRNFLTGNLFIFIVGVVLFATLALLPPLLQDLMNYPVVLTGLVTAPRGIGTLASMFIVGRLMGKVDIRLIIAAGFGITAFSFWQMTGFYLQMDTSMVVWSGLAQGLGTGLVYVPLAAVSFATLSPALAQRRYGAVQPDSQHRQQHRHLGGDDAADAQHADDACTPRRAHHALQRCAACSGSVCAFDVRMDSRCSTRASPEQAAMIAYNDDFKLMMVLTLCAIPFVVLLRSTKPQPGTEPVVME